VRVSQLGRSPKVKGCRREREGGQAGSRSGGRNKHVTLSAARVPKLKGSRIADRSADPLSSGPLGRFAPSG
jgi:hypothetical protein